MSSNKTVSNSGGPAPSGAGSGGGSGSGAGPCGACKFLRRKCLAGCIFAPYFDSEQGAAHFAAVHKVFGASNFSKILLHVPAHSRLDAVVTICFEAQARLRDPVYGCVAHIFALQQQVVNLQAELTYLHAHLATLQLPTPPPQAQPLLSPPPLSISELPQTTSSLPATYDLSSLFDPMVQQQPSWTMPPRQTERRQFGGGSTTPSESLSIGGQGDLQELALELLQRRDQSVTAACNDASPPLPPQT